MYAPEDTQPRNPLVTPPTEVTTEMPRAGRSGCLAYGLLMIAVGGFALLIILLAGLAGWSTGQRTAQTDATATQSAVIVEQLNRLPGDIAAGNTVLVDVRLRYLTTLTPGVPGVADFVQTATAVFQQSLPTPTPEPVLPTVGPTSTPSGPTPTPNPAGRFDLARLFQQAQTAVSTADWDTAIETLDAIIAIDSTYETAAVRTLMRQALTSKALFMFRAPDSSNLAEALRLTDRARQYGDIGELEYESYIASLYLDAVNATGIDYNTAIQRLIEVYRQVPGYRDVLSRLIGQYTAYADALVAQAQPCAAVVQYQNALNYANDLTISSRRDAATTACTLQATQLFLTQVPGTPPPEGFAPVGVPPTSPPG